MLALTQAGVSTDWQDRGDWTVPCPTTVTPMTPTVASSSGTVTFSVTAAPECAWTAPPTSDFLTLSAGGEGSGNGQVSYTYPANTLPSSRMTQPVIADQTLTVTQVGNGQTVPGDEVVYYHHDAIGSVRVVTDASGNVLRRHDFTPFGVEWPPPSSSPDQLLFTAQERDSETGRDYFGARYYIAQLERFTSPDPLAMTSTRLFEPGRANRYIYASNNPFKYVDPAGLEDCPVLPWADNYTCVKVDVEQVGLVQDDIGQLMWRWWVWLVAQMGGQAAAQNEMEASGGTGRPTPTQLPQAPIYCQPDVIRQMEQVHLRTRLTNKEWGFIVFGEPASYRVGNLIEGTSSTRIVYPLPREPWFAFFHTHPTRGWQPSSDDRMRADQYRVQYYMMSNTGLGLYDGATRQSTERLRPNLEWLNPCQ